MTGKERELARKLREAKQQIAAHDQIQRATREGCAAALQVYEERVAEALRERDRARYEAAQTLAQAAEVQQHNGRLYRRLKEVDALVVAHQKALPPEFVAAVRAQTKPDFAELLGVGQ